MAKLSFYPQARKNPVTKEIGYYAQKITYTNVSPLQLVQRIVANTGIPSASINAAVSAITDSVINFVLNGHSVQIGDIMSIRATVSSNSVPMKDDVTAKLVKKLNFRVAWGTEIKNLQDPANYSFEKKTGKNDVSATAESFQYEEAPKKIVAKKATKAKE